MAISVIAAVVECWVVCAPVDARLGILLGIGDGSRDVAADGTIVLGESAGHSGRRGRFQNCGSCVFQMPGPGAAAADSGAAAADT
jgi:hypothetical protein